ncbi:DUF2267 domain-containing protein [Streptomyces sp. NPDC059740]|uniref:DUF2267 domain-containing protein n=1 Tax=Streptomyces sp. NPDC059740 TaxID=3346926 RepID=UPI003657CBFF
MTYDAFVAKVRELGEYASREEAEQATTVVLQVLGSRLTAGSVRHLAAQLPPPLHPALESAAAEDTPHFGVEEFCRQVAEVTDAAPHTAEWDASAVLSTVAQTISGGELNRVLSQLPSGYAALFGKPELSS